MIEYKKPIKGFPNLLLIASQPGVGKSTLIDGLNVGNYKALHLDLQGGAAHVGGYILDVKGKSESEGTNMLTAFMKSVKYLKDQKKEGVVYDFVAVDPLTSLKPIIQALGTKLYNDSLVGKAKAVSLAKEKYGSPTPEQIASCKSVDVLTDLGQNGWNFLNQAWTSIFNDLTTIASKCTIFLAHTKYNTLKKSEISEISVKEIDFWPSYLLHLIGESSDSGMLYREDNKCIVSFAIKADQSHFKSRNFDGKEIVLSEKDSEGNIKVDWTSIFPFLKEK